MSSKGNNWTADFDDTEGYGLGTHGEELIEQLIIEQGWSVLPARMFGGDGAPMLETNDYDGLILPDLWAADGDRSPKFIEVKTKSSPIEYRIKNEIRHGFESYQFDHYKRVQECTGCEVWVLLYEEDSGELLQQSLDTLDRNIVQREDAGTAKVFDSPGVFFLRSVFEKVSFEADDRAFGERDPDDSLAVDGGLFALQ